MPSGVRHGCGGALLGGLVYIVGGSYAARAQYEEMRGDSERRGAWQVHIHARTHARTHRHTHAHALTDSYGRHARTCST